MIHMMVEFESSLSVQVVFDQTYTQKEKFPCFHIILKDRLKQLNTGNVF